MGLLLTVGVGVVAHELTHAPALSLLGIQCDIDIGPERVGTSQFDAAISGTWAAVTPREIPPETPAWAMRLASVAPLVLAVPFVTVVTGVVPDPVQADSLLLGAWTVGWLACAIPSPRDFSMFWHPERAVARQKAGSTDG
jgi:hypothetical protein